MMNVNYQYLFKKNNNVSANTTGTANSATGYTLNMRKKISTPGFPKKLFSIGEQIYVVTSRELYSIDSYTKERTKLFN